MTKQCHRKSVTKTGIHEHHEDDSLLPEQTQKNFAKNYEKTSKKLMRCIFADAQTGYCQGWRRVNEDEKKLWRDNFDRTTHGNK